MDLNFLYRRPPQTHKGDYGYVFVLGGSPGLTGAICLCAQSALRIGAGLVRAGVPASLNSIFEIKLTEVMTLPLKDRGGYILDEAFGEVEKILKRIDVIALGCGAGNYPSTQKLILKIIKEIDKPLVIDADGINALKDNLEVLEKRRTKELILTPHLGEFSRLIKRDISEIKEKKRKTLVKEFSLRYNLVLVLKGHHTLVCNGKEIYQNLSGNPGMATAGSGDVLTGIISGLLAQGLDVFSSAQMGVYLHGLAGDLAAKEKTQAALIASDIIEYLPCALKYFSKNKKKMLA